MMPDFNVGDLVEIVKPILWYDDSWVTISHGTHKIKSVTKCDVNNGYIYYYGIELETVFGSKRLEYYLSEDLCFIGRTIMPLNIDEII